MMDQWKDIMKSWANMMDVAEPVITFQDLNSEFIFKCSKFLSTYHSVPLETHEDIEIFIKGMYPKICFTSASNDEERLLLKASLLLIACSLHIERNPLREKLCLLPTEKQTLIKYFLEKFIDVPRDAITNETIKSYILLTIRRDFYQTTWTTPTSTTGNRTPSGRSSSRRKARQILKLREQIEFLEKTQCEVQEENDNLKDAALKLEKQLEQRNREIVQLKMALKSKSKSRSSSPVKPCAKCQLHERKLTRMEEEIQRLNGEMRDFDYERESFKKKVAQCESEANSLKSELEETKCALAALEIENSSLLSANEALIDETKKLEEAVQSLRAGPSSPNRDTSFDALINGNNLAAEITDVRLQELAEVCYRKDEQITELNQRINELTAAVSHLTDDMETKRAAISELDDLIGRKDLEISKQFECIVKLKQEIENDKRKIHQIEEHMRTTESVLKGRLEEETRAKEKTAEELERCRSLKTDCQSQVTQLETKLGERLADLKKAIAEIEEMKFILFEQESFIKELEASNNELKKEMEESTETHYLVLNEVKSSLEHEIRGKVIALEQSQSQIEHLNGLLTAKSELLDEERSLKKDLEAHVTDLECQIAKYEANSTALETHLSRTQQELDKMTKELESSRRRNEVIEQELIAKNETLLSLSKSLNELSKKYFDETQNHMTLAQALREQAETKTEEVRCLETTLIEKTSQLERLEGINVDLSNALQESTKQLAEASIQYKTLSEERDKLSEESQAYGQRIEDLTREVQTLKVQISESWITLEKKNEENERLAAAMRHAEHQAQSLKDSESQLKCQIHCLEDERNELAKIVEIKSQDNVKYAEEMKIVRASLDCNLELTKKLQDEVESNLAKYREETSRLNVENKNLRAYLADMEADQVKSCQLRKEYDKKMMELAEKAKQVYSEKVKELKAKVADEVAVLRNDLIKEKDRVKELSDRLLIVQEEKRALAESHEFQKPQVRPVGPISNPAFRESPPMFRSQSIDNLPSTSRGIDNQGLEFSAFDDSFTSRRSSIRSIGLPKGIGKVFPAAEEEGEVFDSRCLADLKAGICNVPRINEERMSILQKRNSMCPPHLRSSYPVETQFLDPRKVKEDELRNPGNARVGPSTSQIPKPEPKKKSKIQASYKKPGPPTPVKNAAQQSSQQPAPERGGFVLKENNTPRRSTPSRIKALFQSKRGDQNTPPTRNRR